MKISFSTMSTLMSLFLLGCLGFASAAGELQVSPRKTGPAFKFCHFWLVRLLSVSRAILCFFRSSHRFREQLWLTCRVVLSVRCWVMQARLHPVQGEPVPGQLQIQLQILNKDPENPLEIPQRIFPVAGEPEEEFPYLPQDLFEVRDSEGHPAEYVGMLARRSASEPATVLLAPNGVLSSVLDLSRDYALEKDGVYTVTYRANLDEEHTVVSNTLEVRVSDPQGDRRKTYASLSAPQGPAGWINCGATENQLIGRAAQAATNLTRNSWSCLRQGTCRGPFSRWFGAQSASAQNQVLSHTARMWQHFNAGSYRVWCNHPQCQSDIVSLCLL